MKETQLEGFGQMEKKKKKNSIISEEAEHRLPLSHKYTSPAHTHTHTQFSICNQRPPPPSEGETLVRPFVLGFQSSALP